MLSLLLLGILASPFYVFKSGLPQPADFILIVFAITAYLHSLLIWGRMPSSLMPRPWLYLVLWVVIVVLAWSLIMLSSNFLMEALFWIYNLLVSSSLVYLLVLRPDFKRYFEMAVQLSLLISGVGVVLSLGFSVRPTGFFNNPNQLAFYSLCGLAILQALNKGYIKMGFLGIASFGASVLGILAAASLAAISGLALLVAAHVIASRDFVLVFRTVLVGGLAIGLIMMIDSPIKDAVLSNVEYRMQVADKKVDSVSEERNYDRIIEFPQYTLLGAGEAHLERFYPYDVNEIHSSFGNLIFSYGIPGLLLFVLLSYIVLRRAPTPIWFVLFGLYVYSVTHMGLRTTSFWIFFAIVWYEYGMRGASRVD